MKKYKADDPYFQDSKHYSVYVILLSDDVGPRDNPDFPSVYVGQTGKRPDDRFIEHKSGYKSSKYPKKYGVKLLPELYEKINLLSYDESKIAEKNLAEELRKTGFTVYGGH